VTFSSDETATTGYINAEFHQISFPGLAVPYMPSTLIVSALGALQASISVLITLGYGLIAARLGMVQEGTARDVASLCRNIFLPALLITDIGSQLDHRNVLNYAPIFTWSIAYTAVSVMLGKTVVHLFGLPTWTVTAVAFNNSTSLPLLLTESLLETGILGELAGGDIRETVARVKSYFLINSLVSKVLAFAIGPTLFGEQAATKYPPIESDEETCLLSRSSPTSTNVGGMDMDSKFFQRFLKQASIFLNPTTWGGIVAIIFGLVPSLHHVLFAPSNEGGFLNAWFTSSLRNMGALFSGMEV